jgi:hypothetical protein
VVTALGRLAQKCRAGCQVRELGLVEGRVRRAISQIGRKVIPSLTVARYSIGDEDIVANVLNVPRNRLVGIVPHVGNCTGPRHIWCHEVASERGIDSPGEINRVDGAPASDVVVPRSGTVGSELISNCVVIAITPGGYVVKSRIPYEVPLRTLRRGS